MVIHVPTKDLKFIVWLIKRIKIEILSSVDRKKLKVIDIFLSSIHERISAQSVIRLFVNNLKYRESLNGYIIFLNTSIRYPGTNIKLDTLSKLINYGCFNMKPYPIFTSAFNNVTTSLNKFHKEYLKERGVRYSVGRIV